MDLRRIWSNTLILIAPFFLSACAGTDANVETPASSFPESTYCSTRNTHSTSFTGEAQFAPRLVSSGGLTAQTSTPIDIVGAEVKVFDSAGNLVNCAETDINGEFSSSVPAVGSYTVKVYSRGDNSLVKVSVLNNPTSNTPYDISVTQNISGGTSVYLLADSSGSVLAGAFNIFHQVYLANKFLRDNTLNFEGTEPNEGAAAKVAIYWTLGLSPGAYYDQPSTAISFFTSTGFNSASRGIYILGGVNGDSSCQDTDHFDNSIIIHEYGHYLEDIYADSNSPGGSHDGNSLIDPRLAWSEGWANYIQAAVQPSLFYRDTIGTPECSGSLSISFNLNTTTQDSISGSVDGEGVFRELSVSRHLYDVEASSNFSFSDIWSAFTSLSQSSTIPFRNVRDINSYLYSNTSGAGQTALTSLLNTESQELDPASVSGNNTNPPYAKELLGQGTPCSSEMEIVGVANVTVLGVSTPHPHQSGHYYSFYYDGSSGSTFTFYVERGSGSTRLADLDWFIYPVQHSWSSLSGLVAGKDYNIDAVNGSSTSETKTLNFSGRAAGWYLIRVFVDTQENGGASIGQRVKYTIRNGADYLCLSP